MQLAAEGLAKNGEKTATQVDFSRPAPDPNAKPEDKVDDVLSIMVFKQKDNNPAAYVLNGRKVKAEDLGAMLIRLARFSKEVVVIIKCTPDSRHGDLVALLDLCEKAGLSNVSVFSL